MKEQITILMKGTLPEEIDKELMQWPLERLDLAIGACEEQIKEWENAIKYNLEWPSEKQRHDMALVSIKNKKDIFSNLSRKYENYQFRKNMNKPPKKLGKVTKEWIEGAIIRQKSTIAIMKTYLKERTEKD